PVRVLQREDDRHWERIVDSELTKIIQAEKFLWSMTLLYGGEDDGAGHEVVLTMNHAAGDGISIIHLFSDLLQILSALSKNVPIDLPAHRLKSPVELMLQNPLSWDEFLANKAASQVQPELLTTWRYHRNEPYNRRQTKAIYRKIGADAVRTLKSGCHQRGATVNAVLNSAMLLAAQHLAGAAISSPLFTLVNLRDKTAPPVDDDYLGCYFAAAATYHQQVRKDSDLYELAEDYQRMLNAAIPLQTNLPREFDLAALEKMVNDLVVSPAECFNLGLSCSNMGAPAIETACGDHRIKAFYALANQPAGNYPMMLNVATLSGEMFCTFLYTHPLMSDDWAVRYVDEFMKILQGSLG
ncbi:MAG TPA: hypothetical protein VN455_00390, partial [Methanotrichaceae archaeon]|nr:hypothetical protein [Methanotrichaceae archaeon]